MGKKSKDQKRKKKLERRRRKERERRERKQAREERLSAEREARAQAWLESPVPDSPSAVDQFIVCPKPFHGHYHAEPEQDTDGSLTVSRFGAHTVEGHRHALIARVTHGMFEHLVADHGFTTDQREAWLGQWLLSVEQPSGDFDIHGPFESRDAAGAVAVSEHGCGTFEQAIYTEAHAHH